MDGSTIGNSLTWRFAVEEVGYTLHDTGDPKSNHQEEQFSRTLALSIMDFTKGFLNRFEGAPEEVFAQFLETGTSEREVWTFDTMVETVNFDRGFERQKKDVRLAISQAVRRRQTARALHEISFFCLHLKFLDEVIDKSVVEVFITKVDITCSGLYIEGTALNGQERR